MATREFIVHNFWWKVTSLLLAVIVWFVVKAQDTSTSRPQVLPRHSYRFKSHPLNVMRDSVDKRPLRVTPNEVDITVTTPITETSRLSASDIQTFVDLAEVDPQTRKAPIRVYVTRGIRLEKITPTEAMVEIVE